MITQPRLSPKEEDVLNYSSETTLSTLLIGLFLTPIYCKISKLGKIYNKKPLLNMKKLIFFFYRQAKKQLYCAFTKFFLFFCIDFSLTITKKDVFF